MISIFIIDDHPIIREALTHILEDQQDFHVVGTASSPEDVRTQLPSLHPDVILLDLDLSDSDGAQLIPEILRFVPSTRILIFSGQCDGESITRSLQMGAKGYILKGSSTEEVARAIRSLHDGGSYLEPKVASRLLHRMAEPLPSEVPLSEREREVLHMVAEGHPNKTIANGLGISVSTVKYHLSSIFIKLNVENRAQAVAVAMQNGLLKE
jgi:DNA-binding NarL/FixJ family response regulator